MIIVSIASPHDPQLKKAKPSKRISRDPSKSDSSELEDDDLDIPSLANQLNAVRPNNLFTQNRKSDDSTETGLW